METKIDHTIQYGQTVKRDSDYKFTKIVQNTGGESLDISTSQLTSTFEIPSVGFNLAKSLIVFDQTIPKSANAGEFVHAFRDTPPFARVELFTRGGTYLMDVTNYAHANLAMGERTKTVTAFQCSTNDITSKTATGDILRVVYGQLSGATTGDVIQRWEIRGEELVNTVMSLDKTIYLGEVLQLRITWVGSAAHGVESKTVNIARNDTATPAPNTDPKPLTGGAIRIRNLALYLSQEVNPMILQELHQVVSTSGMSVLIPYTHAYKTNLSGASNAVSLRFSRGHGVSLERVYTLFTTGDDDLYERYVSDVRKYESFYSLLDSKRMQEFDINVLAGDYRWTKRKENDGRVVGLVPINNELNFSHSDSWCGDELECAKHQHVGGLDLSTERKYDMYITRAAATVALGSANYYSFAVCQKQLMVGPGGVQVM